MTIDKPVFNETSIKQNLFKTLLQENLFSTFKTTVNKKIDLLVYHLQVVFHYILLHTRLIY